MADPTFDSGTGTDITPGASRQTYISNDEAIYQASVRKPELRTPTENDLGVPDDRIPSQDLPVIRLASAMMGMNLSEFILLAPYLCARDYLQSNRIDPFSLKEIP